MPNRSIQIFEEDVIIQNVVDSSGVTIVDDGANRVIEIIAEGPRGPVGPRGPTGFSGAGEPFYIVVSGSLYATTSSLALFGSISSSILPSTGSDARTTFDLGSNLQPWRSVYVSESIFIIKSGVPLVQLAGEPNTLVVGQSKIGTASFGFDFRILNRSASDQATFMIQSASVSMSFDSFGIFSVPDFGYLPESIVGGLIKSGSDFFIGI